MKPSSQPRTPSRLSDSLHHQLNMYALAAGAAGVGALAMAQPAEAKIIYTPANKPIANGSTVVFHYGSATRAEFNFTTFFTEDPSSGSFKLEVWPVGEKNRIWGTAGYASYLGRGVRIGPNNKKFETGHDLMEEIWWGLSGGTRGPWRAGTQGYLGLKLLLQGKPHYGWARVIVASYSATLTGYAYETIPNKAIITGKTKGPDVTVEPATLGRLALGRK